MSLNLCNLIDGFVHDEYSCAEAEDVCCNEDGDTDTGYKNQSWKCLICDEPAEQRTEFRWVRELPPPAEDSAQLFDQLTTALGE